MYISAGKSEACANDSLRAFAWLFTVSQFFERKLKEGDKQRGMITWAGWGGKEQLKLKSIHVFMKYEKTCRCEQSMQLQFHLDV